MREAKGKQIGTLSTYLRDTVRANVSVGIDRQLWFRYIPRTRHVVRWTHLVVTFSFEEFFSVL